MNLTNVRSATIKRLVVAALAAGALACGWAAPAAGTVEKPTITRFPPNVLVMVLPSNTTVGQLAAAGLSPGLMSTGIGEVPPEQTYLDISQGNRVDDTLYDRPLPPLRSFLFRVPHWQQSSNEPTAPPPRSSPGCWRRVCCPAGSAPRRRRRRSPPS